MSDPEDFEEAVRRFIENEEDLAQTATREDWFTFLDEKMGVDLTFNRNVTNFMEEVGVKAKELIGVDTQYIEKTGQAVFRIPKGEPGAGRFMSAEEAEKRIGVFKAL